MRHNNYMTRLAVVIGNSTIEDIERNPEGKQRGSHYDLIQINGASVEDMKRAIKADLRDEARPIDALIVAPGIHDLEEGKDPKRIIEEIAETTDMIESSNEKNTIGLGKLPYPPRLSKVYNETSYIDEDHTPVGEYSKEIKKINVAISHLNRQPNRTGTRTVKAPGQDMVGLKLDQVQLTIIYSSNRMLAGFHELT